MGIQASGRTGNSIFGPTCDNRTRSNSCENTLEAKYQGRVALRENEYPLLNNVITPHENIITAYHSSKKENEKDGKEMVNIWIIMEYCKFGD